MNEVPFRPKDIKLLSDSYFRIIRITEAFIELQSVNTSHCWIIKKHEGYMLLFHKHSKRDCYYHKHKTIYSIKAAISEIKSHDSYVLNCSSN